MRLINEGSFCILFEHVGPLRHLSDLTRELVRGVINFAFGAFALDLAMQRGLTFYGYHRRPLTPIVETVLLDEGLCLLEGRLALPIEQRYLVLQVLDLLLHALVRVR